MIERVGRVCLHPVAIRCHRYVSVDFLAAICVDENGWVSVAFMYRIKRDTEADLLVRYPGGLMLDARILGAPHAISPADMLMARRGHRPLSVDRPRFPGDDYHNRAGLSQLLGLGAFCEVANAATSPFWRSDTTNRGNDPDGCPRRGPGRRGDPGHSGSVGSGTSRWVAARIPGRLVRARSAHRCL